MEPAQMEWASPILFAPKKDGTLQFCVDYGKLNAVTKRVFYSIPWMNECFAFLGDAAVSSMLDANSKY